MKKRMIWGLCAAALLSVVFVWMRCGAASPVSRIMHPEEVNLTVLATADLHGDIPVKLAQYIKDAKKEEKNLILVDAGDFFDMQNSMAMQQWFKLRSDNWALISRRMPPIVRDMGELGYDAVVMGNHEFVANDRASLDELVLHFTDLKLPVLSANLYKTSVISPYTKDYCVNYVNPYIIKEIQTDQGVLKVGIVGLTIREVGESCGPVELKDMPQYNGSLVLTDMIPSAAKIVECLKLNGVDVVIAVVHAGEEPRKPRHPGNRVKELARSVEGIDAIVAAHTHANIPEHVLRNQSGRTVIVTQPGAWGKYCSRINFVLTKENGKWQVIDKSSTTVKTDK